MLNRITMLYWTRRPVFVLLLAALLLLGGCTGEDMKTIGTSTAAGVLGDRGDPLSDDPDDRL